VTSTRICRRITLAAVALSGALLTPSMAATAAAEGGMDIRTGASAQIDRWIEDRMAARDLPGVAVAVVRGGRVVHLAGYGAADPSGRAVTPDTPFVIGSASKPFTAMVVRQLVDEGRLSLDADINAYLPFRAVNPHHPDAPITLRHLATHTSGITDRWEVYREEAMSDFAQMDEPFGDGIF
jgi:CubicO group peptidase (beta-lactamase class C family)